MVSDCRPFDTRFTTYSAGVGVGVGVLVAEGLVAVSVLLEAGAIRLLAVAAVAAAGPHRARKHRAGSLRISG